MNKYFIIGIVILLLNAGEQANAQDNVFFQFDRKGEFKIAQFTDLHLQDKTQDLENETIQVVEQIIKEEEPDLVILTGDVVTSPPVKKGWLTIGKIFERNRMLWAVALGNHDGRDAGKTRNEVFNIIEDLPYFVGKKGPDISGVGNYAIPIKKIDGSKVSSVVYIFDSHNRPINKKFGHWDWIKDDQINWYRKTSAKYTLTNHDKPLPSLAFFHIPIPEFENLEEKLNTIGIKGEGISSPKINSGLFSAFLSNKDVIGVFTGHDHDNDYIGINYGIALSFGRVTGEEAYGRLERGARIIKLYEDEFKFDTWIRTRSGLVRTYHFPSGISSIDKDSLPLLPAKTVKSKSNGLNYTYYKGGRFKKIVDIKTNGKVIKSGRVDNFTLKPATVHDSIAFVFKGLIDIPKNGIYRFYSYSDDGSCLTIDDKLVVDNDGSHNAQRVDGKIGLEAGLHKIKLEYFQDYMGKILEIGWASQSIYEEKIPNEVLYTPTN